MRLATAPRAAPSASAGRAPCSAESAARAAESAAGTCKSAPRASKSATRTGESAARTATAALATAESALATAAPGGLHDLAELLALFVAKLLRAPALEQGLGLLAGLFWQAAQDARRVETLSAPLSAALAALLALPALRLACGALLSLPAAALCAFALLLVARLLPLSLGTRSGARSGVLGLLARARWPRIAFACLTVSVASPALSLASAFRRRGSRAGPRCSRGSVPPLRPVAD